MHQNPLDAYPLDIRNIKSLDGNSRKYKKSLHELSVLLSGFLLSDILHSKKDEPANVYKRKYLTNLYLTIGFIVAIVIVFAIELKWNEMRGVYELTSSEIIHLSRFIIELFLLFTFTFLFAFRARGVIDRYLAVLIETHTPRCPHFPDDLIRDVANAYRMFNDNHELLNQNLRYGCYSCLKVFSKDDMDINMDITEKFVKCPFCQKSTIICESNELILSEDFLHAMKEYWVDAF